MGRSAGKEIGNQVLHWLLVLAGLLPVAARPDEFWTWVLSGLWFMFWREDAQHRKPDKTPEGWAWPVGGYWRWVDIAVGAVFGGLSSWAFARFFFEH